WLEYQAAFQANTNNPYFRNQLAEFFRRHGEYERAVDVWLAGLTNATATDSMWLRAWFWSRVARPRPFDWNTRPPPAGPLQPLLFVLAGLPPGTFWNETAYAQLPAPHAGEWVQETFWLRLLAALQAGQEHAALELLRTNSFRAESYHLDLESALIRALEFRRTGQLIFPDGVNIPLNPAPPRTRHQFFEALDEATRSAGRKPADALERLLRSPHAFAAIFLAAGWAEAALRLPHPEVVPDDYPDWLAFGFSRAYALNRSAEAGLAYAGRQKSTPALELLSAELLLSLGRYADAILKVMPLAREDSDNGAQAAQLIAETYLRLKQLEEAQTAVETNPRLKQSVRGRELLARIALARGDRPTANQIYTALETVSDEAKEYLAQEALADRKWERARALTQELLRKQPDQPRHWARLQAIEAAQQRR
ncbi:MAG: hypothetical protein RMK20_08030, partial [Verrucomicrobiales bacterium]|nr:hypothetical protein [Verrucomicrobiales bacterium]